MCPHSLATLGFAGFCRQAGSVACKYLARTDRKVLQNSNERINQDVEQND